MRGHTVYHNLCVTSLVLGVVTAEDDAGLDSHSLNYPLGYDYCNRLARDASRGAVGCPLGIQVVGRHYQEEMVVHVMEIIKNREISAPN